VNSVEQSSAPEGACAAGFSGTTEVVPFPFAAQAEQQIPHRLLPVSE